jgi:hypothetical protein
MRGPQGKGAPAEAGTPISSDGAGPQNEAQSSPVFIAAVAASAFTGET